MNLFVMRAWIALLRYDLVATSRGYKAAQEPAKRLCSTIRTEENRHPWQTVCDAVERAAVLYFKQVHCLQRSSVTAGILREEGWDARLVVGVQLIPFASHAWVELNGAVVNDKPYMREKYQVLAPAEGGSR